MKSTFNIMAICFCTLFAACALAGESKYLVVDREAPLYTRADTGSFRLIDTSTRNLLQAGRSFSLISIKDGWAQVETILPKEQSRHCEGGISALADIFILRFYVKTSSLLTVIKRPYRIEGKNGAYVELEPGTAVLGRNKKDSCNYVVTEKLIFCIDIPESYLGKFYSLSSRKKANILFPYEVLPTKDIYYREGESVCDEFKKYTLEHCGFKSKQTSCFKGLLSIESYQKDGDTTLFSRSDSCGSYKLFARDATIVELSKFSKIDIDSLEPPENKYEVKGGVEVYWKSGTLAGNVRKNKGYIEIGSFDAETENRYCYNIYPFVFLGPTTDKDRQPQASVCIDKKFVRIRHSKP